MARDDRTTDFYSREAAVYAASGAQSAARHIETFAARLAPGGTVLELGCGAGRDSAFFLSKGFVARPTDGTPEIALEAEKRLGVAVPVMLFHELDEEATCDGIWANACLLHVPRQDLPDVIARIHRALKKGGAFYASYKAGEAEGRDRFDRYYNYPSEAWLRALYGAHAWSSIDIVAEAGGGYDGQPTDWLHVTAIRS